MNRTSLLPLALLLAATPIRGATAPALGAPAPGGIPPEVRRQLDDRDPRVRSQGLKSLKGRVDGETAAALLPFLDDEDSYCRDYTALLLLGRAEEPATVAVIAEGAPRAATREGRRAAADALLAVGTPATLPGLLKLAGDRDPWVRQTALDGIGRVGNLEEVPVTVALRQGLADGEPGVRAAALEAAARLRFPESGEAIRSALEDRDPGVRTAAAALLAKEDREAFAAALPALAADGDWGVRLVAVRGAGGLRKDPPVPLLAGLLGDPRLRVADAAHDALRLLSGLEIPPAEADWLSWWEGARAKWQEGSGRRARDADRPSVATYHGLPFRSDALLFVVDLSGSMHEPLGAVDTRSRLEVARGELSRTLNALPDDTEADLLTFMLGTDRALGRLRPLGGGTRTRIGRWFERRPSGKRGDLGAALVEALSDPSADTVILLADGDASSGEYLFRERIRERVRQCLRLRPVALHAIAFGSRPSDRQFLEDLAEMAGGRCVER